MTLRGFQQALSELVLSPDLRSQVADQGTDALLAFDLDSREKRRLLAIAEQSTGLNTGVLIHRSFRLSMVVRSLPLTCKRLGSRLSDLIHEYWRGNLPLHYNFVWESCRFARYLRDLAQSDLLDEPWLTDALRIDLASLALKRGLKPEEVDLDPQPGGIDLAAAPTGDRFELFCRYDPRVLLTDPVPDADTETSPSESHAAPADPNYRLIITRQPDGSLDFESA